MKMSRLGALGLASVWFAACATAENSGSPGGSDVGANGTTNGGAHAGGSSNGAFGGSASMPGGSGSTGRAGAGVGGSATGTSGAGGLASGGASGSSAGGTAGSAGASGAGGSGGGAPVFDTGVCAQNPTVAFEYMDSSNNPRQITGQYQITNTATTPIPLQTLKIRYFFTNEETSVWKMMTYSPKIDGGTLGYRAITGTTFTEAPLPTPLDGADSYSEVGFPAGLSVEQNATVTVSWDMQPTDYNPPDQVQTNDYSFNGADTVFTAWDHVAVYEGNTLVYGCVPKSLSDGAAGAGGDTGAGGAETGGTTGTAGSAGLSGSSSAGTAGSAGSGGSAGAGTGGNGSAGTGGSAGTAGASAGGTAGTGGTAGSL